jgi:hypothetical protein
MEFPPRWLSQSGREARRPRPIIYREALRNTAIPGQCRVRRLCRRFSEQNHAGQTIKREAPPRPLAPAKTRRHSEERFPRRRISSMLPRQDRHDEDAVDVMSRGTQDWLRFFAALRMTAVFWGRKQSCMRFALENAGGAGAFGKAAAVRVNVPPLSKMGWAAQRPRTLRDASRGGRRASAPRLMLRRYFRRWACSLSRARSPAGVVMTVSGRRIAA